MRTTLNIDDALYRDLKSTAALAGRSVTSLVEEALRNLLRQQASVEELPPLPVSRSLDGLTDEFMATGIDFNDTSEVLAWLDDIETR